MRIGLGACMSLIMLSSTAHAGTPDPPATYEKQAQSSFVEHKGADTDSLRIVNTTYAVEEVSIDTSDRVEKVLLEQQSVWNQDWDTDASIPDMTVNAYVIAKGRFDKPLWVFHEAADKGEIWSGYYRTTVLGREGAEDLIRYHDLATGRTAFLTTTEPAFVSLAKQRGVEPFVIYYVSNKTGDDFSFTQRHPDAFGLLVIRRGGQVVDQVVLASKDGRIDWASPEILARDEVAPDKQSPGGQQYLTLADRDGLAEAQAKSWFELRLCYENDTDKPLIVIPVKDGRFAIESVALPHGVSLRRDTPRRGEAPGL